MLQLKISTFFDKLGVDDHAARKLLAKDFSWWISGVGQVDEKFIEIGAAMAQHVSGKVRFRVLSTILGDKEAFAEVAETATLNNGTSYETRSGYRLTFDDNGLITAIREYTDTKGAAAIWEPLLS